MDKHFVGQGQFSGGASSAQGSSLAVRQFASFAFGWSPVHRPTAPFRVETVTMEERYCLACFGARRFDVIRGEGRAVAVCRCCGAEFGKGEMA